MIERERRDALILGLFEAYLDAGRVLTSAALARVAGDRLGRRLARSTVRYILENNGYEPSSHPGPRNSVLERLGEERIAAVGRRYVAGDLTLRRAAEELGCNTTSALRWFGVLGYSRSAA